MLIRKVRPTIAVFGILCFCVHVVADTNNGLCDDTYWRNAAVARTRPANDSGSDRNGWTELHWAVKRGTIEYLQQLLRDGANPNAMDIFGRTPLHLAAKGTKESLQTSRALLDHGANVNATCRYLHEPPNATRTVTPLHLAVRYSNRDLVELLIARGADVNAQDHRNSTPLHEAVWAIFTWADSQTSSVIADRLIKAEADVSLQNAHGNTPIHEIMEAPFRRELRDLLITKAPRSVLNLRNKAGLTPLMIAASTGMTDAAIEMQRLGGNIFATDRHGNNALHLAIMNDNAGLAQTFVASLDEHAFCAAASIDNRDQDGLSALELAIMGGHAGLVQALIEAGAQVNLRNPTTRDEMTPLHCAVHQPNAGIVQILLNNGADMHAREASMGKRTPYGSVSVHFGKEKQARAVLQLLERYGGADN